MTDVMTKKPDRSSSTAAPRLLDDRLVGRHAHPSYEAEINTSAMKSPAPVVRDASALKKQDPWASLVTEHRLYVVKLAAQGLISPKLGDRGLKIWWKLYCSVAGGDLAVPDASPGPNGELVYIWKRGEHYLSLQMAEEGPGEFFHLNDRTGEVWDFDYDSNEHPVPAEVVSKLSLFMTNP